MAFKKITESDSHYHGLEKMKIKQLLININEEDKKAKVITKLNHLSEEKKRRFV